MRVLTLDFETYFDKSYSLKSANWSTESYVRTTDLHEDGKPLFKAFMVGLKYPGVRPAIVSPDELRTDARLRRDIEASALVAHHAHFDGLILEHHYGLRPALWLDTLSMARLLLPKLRSHSLEGLASHFGLAAKTVPYDLFRGLRELPPDVYRQLAAGCAHDVDLTDEIARRLLPLVPPSELKVIDATIRMFTEPCLRLDRPRMEAFLRAERIKKAKAMLAAGEAIGLPCPLMVAGQEGAIKQHLERIETELQSSDKFRIALEALGFPCPTKWSDKAKSVCTNCNGSGDLNIADAAFITCEACAGKGKTAGGHIPALAKNDPGMKELLEHDDIRVQALASARLGVKSTIDETRAERLLDSDRRGSLPVYLSYAAAKTLRFGGGDKTNWQNFRRGGEIRKSIKAPEGHKLVIGDLSQIEYRLLLWCVGQDDKLSALAAGVDLYCEFASEFYHEVIVKEDKPRRGVGKQGILMGGYGAGAGTQIATAASGGYGPPIKMTDAEGQRMVDLYRKGHPMVKQGWKTCDYMLQLLHDGKEGGPFFKVVYVRDHKIHLPNGTFIDYTGLRWARNCDVYPDQEDDGEGYAWWETSRKGYTRTWGSHVTADIIQALACAVIKDVWVRMAKHGFRPALQVHDELVYVDSEDTVSEPAGLLQMEMKKSPVWCSDIPLECEIIVSDIYEK